ncbi:MAG: hypothetical protein MJ106_01800 [Lentisphaeria bacterium]|nr:hypothetical protein [Lentisphaeria bacterium]
MKRLLTTGLLLSGAFLWAEMTLVAEATSDASVVDTRDSLGARLVHGTVRISPVAEEAGDDATLLIDETAPEWSVENPLWNSTTVADGVHAAELNENDGTSQARLVVLNSNNYVYEGGDLEGDVTWNNDAIHIVQYGVKIPEDASLTVGEGAVVKLCQGAEIISNGLMKAEKGAVLGNLSEAEVTGQEITVDEELSETSTNPVQNKVINSAIASLTAKDTALENGIAGLTSDVSELKSKANTVEGQIPAITADIESLKSGSTAAVKDIETLQGNLTAVQNNLTAVQSDLTAVQGTVAEQQTAIKNTQDAVTALQSADVNRDAAIAALQTDNAELKSQLSALLAVLNGGTEGQVLTKAADGSYAWMDAKVLEVNTLTLEKGWNLVAMPGRWLLEESDKALLDTIDIYTFDRKTQIYAPADGLKPLTSYWFYAKEPCTIHFAVMQN